MNYFMKLQFQYMPAWPKTDVLIAISAIMMLNISIMHNGSEIDLHVLSRQLFSASAIHKQLVAVLGLI
jgi:hypothetical protein